MYIMQQLDHNDTNDTKIQENSILIFFFGILLVIFIKTLIAYLIPNMPQWVKQY